VLERQAKVDAIISRAAANVPTQLTFNDMPQIVFAPWAEACKPHNNRRAWAKIGIVPFTRLPMIDVYRKQFEQEQIKIAMVNTSHRIVQFEDRDAKFIFPLPITREIDPDKKLDSGTIALTMPATDDEIFNRVVEDAAAKKAKEEKTKANLESREQKLSVEKTSGGVIWGKVVSGEMQFKDLKQKHLKLVAKGKGYRFTAATMSTYVGVAEMKVQIKSKFGHEIQEQTGGAAAASVPDVAILADLEGEADEIPLIDLASESTAIEGASMLL
jgi:hypothetical protein